MSRFRPALLLAALLCGACARPVTPALLPLPKQYVAGRGSVDAEKVLDRTALRLVEDIPEAGDNLQEAYRLTVRRDSVIAEAVTRDGLWNALQTLRQLEVRGRYPLCSIVDWPSFRIRGFMQDCGRTWISLDELKREIDLLSRFKINVFHWHLTENQAWRLESRAFPHLSAPETMTRQPGKFYTLAQARELDEYCRSRHITLIPEIDMPGHSAAFERAMGFGMQTPEGKAALKTILEEVCATFSGPYIHIGTDETAFSDPSFVPEMVAWVRSKGRKAVAWNPGWTFAPGEIDLMQLWSARGTAVPGIPAVDCRLHYLNHYDLFGDIVALHSSRVYDSAEGSADIAGAIAAVWNDRYVDREEDITLQNAFYPALLALADRTWRGGGWQYFDGFGVALPAGGDAWEDFAEFEQRMIHFLDSRIAPVSTGYVRQADARWSVTDPFPNGGDTEAVFPPETQPWQDTFIHEGKEFGTRTAAGSAVWLRHTWGPDIVPALLDDPKPNSTVYARARIHSRCDQTVGLLFETQNYSRSERDRAPLPGTWDRRGSRIRINGEEILPPEWTEDLGYADPEAPMGNENAVSRGPVPVRLKKGWNEVLVKVPVGAFRTPEVRLVKWMFTCAFTTPDGRHAADIRYAD